MKLECTASDGVEAGSPMYRCKTPTLVVIGRARHTTRMSKIAPDTGVWWMVEVPSQWSTSHRPIIFRVALWSSNLSNATKPEGPVPADDDLRPHGSLTP